MIERTRQPAALTGWMEVLSDPTRLRLLRVLERHELGVADLCDVLQMPQSTVSRHLKLLTEGGWLQNRRQGTASLYRMTGDDLDATARRLWTLAREQVVQTPKFKHDQLRLGRCLGQRQKHAEAFFAGAAGQWDRLRQQLYGTNFNHEATLALLPPTWVVADLGCGTGHLTAALAEHLTQVIGVDQSEAMLKAAAKRTAGAKNVELRCGNLEAVPIDAQTCDAALLVLVLTYVADVPAVLSEAARIVRRGGRLVMIDLLEHDREDFCRQMGQQCLGFNPKQLKAQISAAGFQNVRTRPLPPDANVKGPALLLATASVKVKAGKIGAGNGR